MVDLNDDNYISFIKTGRSLILYYTDWCPLCSPVKALLQEWKMASSLEGNSSLRFGKINFDICHQAVNAFDVTCIPTVLYLENGVLMDRLSGQKPKEDYHKMVTMHHRRACVLPDRS